jgi:hypothetical protein
VATKVEMLSNVTVLIGDTKAARASTLADGLKEFGFGTTTVALSYKEAVAKIEEGGIDVAILADSLCLQTRQGRSPNAGGQEPFHDYILRLSAGAC